MERKKYLVLLILMVYCSLNLNASYRSEIYKAYINSDLVTWKKVLDDMESQKEKSNEFVMELLNYQYGYIAWCIGNKKSREAEKYLELGEKNIRMLETKAFQLSYVNAYKAAFYGFRIGLNKLQAPFIGPKSVECAKLAMKQDNKNPYGFIQYGHSQYYMPAIFGGSKTIALEYYKKAEKIMEQNPLQISEDWNYLNLMTMIAVAYEELKLYQSAKTYFEKILKTEPDYKWVKNELYPKLLKKIK